MACLFPSPLSPTEFPKLLHGKTTGLLSCNEMGLKKAASIFRLSPKVFSESEIDSQICILFLML